MSPFNFLKNVKSSNPILPCYNVSPIFDMITGAYVEGHDGRWYLNGGACSNNVIAGGNNTQKTGLLTMMISRMLHRYVNSVCFFKDVEGTYQVERLALAYDTLTGEYGSFMREIFNVRFFYFNRKDGYDGTWVHNKFKENAASIKQAIKDKEDVYFDSVYKNIDGSPMRLINPLITVADSISEMQFDRISEHFQEEDVDSGGAQKTRDMNIGNMRRIVYEDADVLGGSTGMVQLWTAQVVDKINLTGRPEEKETAFIRPGKKLKGPKSMLRIPPIGYEIIKGSQLKSGTDWMYPDPFGKDVVIGSDSKENPDLMYYPCSTFRNKNNPSGGNFSFIGSQSLGIQEGLSMYHNIKTAGMFGLEGSAITHASVLCPELKITRPTVRSKLLKEQRLDRAMAITYQLWHMQNHWLGLESKYRITTEELFAKVKEKGISWDFILNETVDYWFTNPDIKKTTVSTMELLKVALGEKKADWAPK